MTDQKLPIVIVEGANGVGKTSSIFAVTKKLTNFGYNVIERRNHKASPEDFFIGNLFNGDYDSHYYPKTFEYAAMNLSAWLTAVHSGAINPIDSLVISDRMHLTEIVHGGVERMGLSDDYFGEDKLGIINDQFETYLNRMFDTHLITIVTTDDFDHKDTHQKELNYNFKKVHENSIINNKYLIEISNFGNTNEKVENIINEIFNPSKIGK